MSDEPIASATPVVKAFADRIRDPFLGAFSTAVVAWNWRFIYVLVRGTGDTVATIQTASAQLDYRSYVMPAVFGLAFAAGHQWIQQAVQLMRATAVMVGRNLWKKFVYPEELLTRAGWQETNEFRAMVARAQDLSKCLDEAIGTARMAWVDARPGGRGAGGPVSVDELGHERVPQGFAVRAKEGLVPAEGRRISNDEVVFYALAELPNCGRVVVASPGAPVPCAIDDPSRRLVLCETGAVEAFKADEMPSDAVAMVSPIAGNPEWGLFEKVRR